MKKLIFLFTSVIVSTFAFAQQRYFVDWNGNTTVFGNNAQELPEYKLIIDGNLTNVSIKNPIYQEVNFSNKNLKSDISVQAKPLIQKKKTKTLLTFIPIVYSNGKAKKLISFELNYTSKPILNLKGGSTWKSNSVLNSGKFYKLAVVDKGVYQLTADYIQSTLGVNLFAINPKNIKIYGNGGDMLPQQNSDTRFDDLEENSIQVVGESDGVFNASDYILFYADDAFSWKLNADSTRFEHVTNIYSDTVYYYLTFDGGAGKRMSTLDVGSGEEQDISASDEFYLYEKNEFNVLKSGREWYSDKFDFELNKNFSFALPGYINNTDLLFKSSVMGNSPKNNSFSVESNGVLLGSHEIQARGSGDYHLEGYNSEQLFVLNQSNSAVNLSYTYNTFGAADANGYINFLEFNYSRNLAHQGSAFAFRALKSLDKVKTRYTFTTNKAITVWNITDVLHPKIQSTSSSPNPYFVEDSRLLEEYFVFTNSDFKTPLSFKVVQNQDLHAMKVPDFIIVSHKDFLTEAQRLADFRAQNDSITVEVVELEKIYNEFSSGKQDISAIRNFAKMLYDKDPNGKFKYMLLFGDCSYDYKNITKGNTNFVPVYEAVQSLNPTTTYSSDDYFGFLDDSEGRWAESPADEYLLDIGIGRIVCKTAQEANSIVGKIIYYSKNCEIQGKWKNEVTLIADDGDSNIHITSAEKYSNKLKSAYPVYNVNKIFLDAFPQEAAANGQSAKAVNDAINRKMKSGTLVMNYTGHGGETGLAHERVITVDQINGWDNLDNMPLMFTATCEFGRYDDPERVSAGEYTFLNADGGSIAIITTSRPVFSGSNDAINNAFFNNVFKPLPNGKMPTLGELMVETKNGSLRDVNNRNFTLLGDPSMTLAYPKHNIVVTKLNDSIITLNSDTISALSKVKFEGEVQQNGQLLSGYNGTLFINVFDKEGDVKTLGDESGSVEFKMYKDIIFSGKSTIVGGKFSFSFVVPKDISYQYGNGKISLYAKNEQCANDAHGFNADIVVGGSNSIAAADNEPPQAESFMDDFSFVYGGTTGKDPMFLAKLYDDNGINTAGTGIGHEITAVLDDDRQNIFVLNEYYTTELDDYKKGTVEYPLFELEKGNHNIKLKAWDVYNNSVEDYLEFVVVDEEGISISNLLNYPNPFTTNTEFHFDHNRVGDDLSVKIQIFTLSGKVVNTLFFDSFTSPSHIITQKWDGKDEWGSQLAKGVYIYRVTVKSNTDEAKTSEFQKLLLLK